MNVLFHITAAVGVAVILTDTRVNKYPTRQAVLLSGFAFIVGMASHGVLDYIPHCYPINSKFDALAGFIAICALTILSNRKYRPIVAFALLGGVFPDIIDLSPQLITKYSGYHLSTSVKLFPWHWEQYSGSIFTNDCDVSAINQITIILVVAAICWVRQKDLKNMFSRSTDPRFALNLKFKIKGRQ